MKKILLCLEQFRNKSKLRNDYRHKCGRWEVEKNQLYVSNVKLDSEILFLGQMILYIICCVYFDRDHPVTIVTVYIVNQSKRI